MKLSNVLKALREQKGFTQASLADASGVSLGALRDYEQGKREPLLSNLQRLAKALGVSLDEFASVTIDEPAAKPATKGKAKGGK